jgi:hypothetical protein
MSAAAAKRLGEDSALYLYGVLFAESVARAAGPAPRGLPGASRTRLLAVDGGLWLVVADAPLSQFAPERIEGRLRDLNWVSRCALAHEAVVELYSRRGTLIPVKLFTLFSGEAAAVADARSRLRELRAVAKRVAGCEEWGIQLRLAPGARQAGRPAIRPPRSGTAFLQARRTALHASRDAALRGHERAMLHFRSLAKGAGDALCRDLPAGAAGRRLLLDAVFLVPRRGARRFQSLVRTTATRCQAEGLALSLSGPWPPYHFSRGEA